jgi:hypothetical protein
MQLTKRRMETVRPMKIKIALSGLLAFLVLTAAAKAGDISGKWYVPMDGVDVEMVFKVSGNTLTGTVYNPVSGETKIKEGKIDGDIISFVVVRKFGEKETRIAWTGLVSGEEIVFTRAMGGPRPSKYIAKRERTIPSPEKKSGSRNSL